MMYTLDTHFARAIRKYGADSFTAEIIDTAISQTELTKKEKYWIDFYDSVNKGYNETNAESKCGGNTYLSKSKDDMLKIRSKIRREKIGGKNPMARQVKCKNNLTGEIYHFLCESDMAKFFNENNHQFISRRCLGRLRCMYKGLWLIAYEDAPFPDEGIPKGQVEKRGNRVRATNTNTGEVIVFPSVRAAYRQIGNYFRSRKHMSDVVKGISPQVEEFLLEALDIGVSTIPDECRGVGRETGTRPKRKAVQQ